MSETETALRCRDGRWELPIVGATVTQIRVDFALGLIAQRGAGDGVSCEVRISSPFRFDTGTGSLAIDPERTEQLAPLIALHKGVVEQAFALDDGHLELRFERDRTIGVPPDPRYEAWGLTVTNRSENWSTGLVCLPGSGVAEFETSPSTAPALAARITIVHTRTGMLLTKEEFRNWREIQHRFDNYIASLGPFAPPELFGYLAVEYPTDPPFAREAINEFLHSDQTQLWA